MKETSLTKRVFLSYTRNDQPLAHELSRQLKQLGLDVWDDQSIPAGADWATAISEALAECDSMIALLNEHSFSSSYVRTELQHALFDERYKNRLLPVLMGTSRSVDFARLPWVLNKLSVLKIPKNRSSQDMAKRISSKFVAQLTSAGSKPA